MTSFFDNTLCCSTSVGDLFKLIVPIGWTAVSFAAVLAYLLAPLSRGESPRWGSASVVSVAALSGLGLSAAVFSFHRATSAFSVEWDEWQMMERRKRLITHTGLSVAFSTLSTALVIFFTAFAPKKELCAHETCGADVSWSIIALGTSLLWLGMALLGMRDSGSKKGEEGTVENFSP